MENLINAGFDVAIDKNDVYWFATTTRIGEEIWARLANLEYRHNASIRHSLRSHGGFPPADELNRINNWAKMLKAAAEWDEGSNSPIVTIVDKDMNGVRTLHLNWKGTWTKGREVEVEFFPNDEGGIAYISYKTGTGNPSGFLEDIFISAKAEAEDVVMASQMAKQIRKDLAMAFGGYSQFGVEEVVEAVCGHVRNGTLLRREKAVALEVVAAALLQEEERWSDQPTPTSEAWSIGLKAAEKKVGDCWESQRSGFAARSAGRPRPPAIVD